MHEIEQYIDEHLPEFVQRLQTFLRIPSVGAQQRSLEECAQWLRDEMEKVGLQARIEPVEGGPPVVYAEYSQPNAAKTLMIYGHYDVQPAEPYAEWHHDPFSATLESDRIYARGAVDQKGGLMASLMAVNAFLQVHGKVPVNIRFVVEGEEESGSHHLGAWVEANTDILRADGCIVLDCSVERTTGRPQINPGWRFATLFIELHSRGANREIDSAEAHFVPDAAWRLVWALSTMKDQNEQMLVEGWYDDMLVPSERDLEGIRQFPFDAERLAENLGLDQLLLGRTGHDPLIARWYEPSCTICGIHAGYTGAGVLANVPAHAFAKVDFRLKAGMEPMRQVELLRQHLDKHGFADIEIKVISYMASRDQTPLDAEIVVAAQHAAQEVYAAKPLLFPGLEAPSIYPDGSYAALGPGSMAGPGVGMLASLGIPWVECRYGDRDSYMHAPNEFLSIDSYRKAIRWVTSTIGLFA